MEVLQAHNHVGHMRLLLPAAQYMMRLQLRLPDRTKQLSNVEGVAW